MLALRAKANRECFFTGHRFFQNFYFSDTLKYTETKISKAYPAGQHILYLLCHD
uniref:Uncharacterized protein n=1 Tax=Candidatus Kentrum sp. TUN TaxID=2126343 RepID=A0A450ZB44_9GAMM|nr:MAG: hypothetical protein BECKTUN1418E_GA0071001_100440 [Candidatus Kentron sp. TUN]VFK51024.1 MAG: hypothetical protein BECKTUN1418D_GA0071000_100431 [Candidatus Kentron sp. TUN]VFK52009.1 MAG: hypothetical protein BECKTUN1418F_GA0071002_100440 [Candidatus Kentron sp. TUN]